MTRLVHEMIRHIPGSLEAIDEEFRNSTDSGLIHDPLVLGVAVMALECVTR